MRKFALYMISFVFSFFPVYQVKSYNLVPVSFSQMYNLAQNGEVRALRASVRRGLNIDVTNSNGDTGLCVAARNRDTYTYNAFRAAGANPRHPCVQRIKNYDDFVNNSKAVSINSTSRAAYGKMGKESFSVYPGTWLVLGGLAVGGGVAALAGGGGGGGSSTSSSSEVIISVADYLGQDGKVTTSTNQSIINKNDLDFYNKNQYNISSLNINNDLLNSVKNLDVGFKSFDNGSVYNSENKSIQINSGVVAMAGVNNGNVYNNGYINTRAFNAAISMLASNNSRAVNNGSGIVSQTGDNGIDLHFSGYKEEDTIVGMYGDKGSIIVNNGDIRGSAIQASEAPKENSPEDNNSGLTDDLSGNNNQTNSQQKTSSVGTIIGMETMIINSGVGMGDIVTTAENNGNIDISAGNASFDGEVKVNIIGMGSYLDNSFLNDSKNIKRAEKSILLNKGTISLGYTGLYTTNKDNTLRKGLGGIVGMRADANTTANNSGNIKITLSNDSSNTSGSIDVAAGMQSVHGGDLINKLNSSITIQTPAENARITYGMISVEGSGNVAGLYTNMGQTLNNEGNININASNGFGMASYNGGIVTNTGIISVGTETNSRYNNNVGMYGSSDNERVSLYNKGTINIYSHNSLAMKNDYSGDTVIQNDGIINIYRNAINSSVFGGNYSRAYNNGIINFYALASEDSGDNNSSSGDTNKLFFNDFKFSIKNSVINTNGNNSEETNSSNTESIYNNGTMNIIGSSSVAAMEVGSTQGRAYNNGTINIKNSDVPNTVGAVGMYLYSDSAKNTEIVNNGKINIETKYSAAMASDSTSTSVVKNDINGVIDIYGDNSFGLYASANSYLYNKGIINLYGDNGVALYSSGIGSGLVTSYLSNEEVINVYGNNVTIFAIEGNALVERIGTINICTVGSGGDCSSTAKDTIRYFYVNGKVDLNLSKTIDGGVFAEVGENGELSNANGNVLAATKGTIFKGAGGKLINNGEMNINGKDTVAMLSVEDSGSEIYNNKIININQNAENGIGIKLMKDGKATNVGEKEIKSFINVYAEKSFGVYMDNGAAEFNNQSSATINVFSDYSYGIYASDNGGKITNSGMINVGISNEIEENGSVRGSYGVYVGAKAEFTNDKTGKIYVYGSDENSPSYGIYVKNAGSATNEGYIFVTGKNSYGFYAEDGAEASNEGTIEARNDAISKTDNVEEKEKKEEKEEGEQATAFRLKNYSKMTNNGKIISDSSMNFDDYHDGTGIISLGKKGSFEASAFEGVVEANANITYNSFDKIYSNDNSFIGKDKGLQLISGSYMFDVNKTINNNGNIDVVMTMKDFSDIIENKTFAEYLNDNYDYKKGNNIFNSLKSASNKNSFNNTLNKEFGYNIIPNLAKQSFDLERNINREINNEILDIENQEERMLVKISSYKQKIDSNGNQDGYDDDVIFAYGLKDKKVSEKIRVGYGLTVARSETDFDSESSRYNNFIELFTPINYNKGSVFAMIKPKVGYAKGQYRRIASSGIYKADIEEMFYGFDSLAKYKYDLDFVDVEPMLGFNLTGLYQDSIKENNNGLKISSQNIISAQSVVGLDVKKEINIDSKQSVLLTAGAKYIHEFGNKYRTKATISDMIGKYDIVDKRLERNYGLLDIKAQYNYNNLSFNLSIFAPLENKSNEYYMLGIGYKF